MKGLSYLQSASAINRSLPFYRDLLGLELMLVNEEQEGSGKRRAVYLRWGLRRPLPGLVANAGS